MRMQAIVSTISPIQGQPNRAIREVYQDTDFDPDLFRCSLLETITWCKPRVAANDPVGSLRSPDLTPDGWPNSNYGMSATDAEPVLSKRSQLIVIDESRLTEPIDLEGGKLLMFTPEDCLYEGAVQAETNGFIGDHEEPPWDTWVYYGYGTLNPSQPDPLGRPHEYLISWIPPQFVSLVHNALPVMTIEWLWWIEKMDF